MKCHLLLVDKVILYSLYFVLIVDSVNGFFLKNSINIPISLCFKAIITFIIIARIICKRNNLLLLFLILVHVAILFLSTSLNGGSLSCSAEKIVLLQKFYTLVLFLSYFKYVNNKYNGNTLPILINILKYNFLVIFTSVMLGPLGVGYLQYGGTYSFRGFFYAGNELSGTVLATIPFLIYYYQPFVNKKYRLICYSLLLIFGGLIGTKLGIISIFASVIFVPQLKQLELKKLPLLALKISIAVLILGMLLYHLLESTGMFARWMYFFETGGIEQLVFSSRDLYWSDIKESFYASPFIIKFLGMTQVTSVEMDIHDTMLNFGYVGLFIVYSGYLFLLLRSIMYFYNDKYDYVRIVCFTNILLLISSSIAGHIIYSSMANIFIALINSLQFYSSYHNRNVI